MMYWPGVTFRPGVDEPDSRENIEGKVRAFGDDSDIQLVPRVLEGIEALVAHGARSPFGWVVSNGGTTVEQLKPRHILSARRGGEARRVLGWQSVEKALGFGEKVRSRGLDPSCVKGVLDCVLQVRHQRSPERERLGHDLL